MSSDAWAYLPGNVRLDRVADVIGVLLGQPWEWEAKHRWVTVSGVRVEVTPGVPTMPSIIIGQGHPCPHCGHGLKRPLRVFHYHYEASPPHVGRRALNLGRSRAANIALGAALVTFFGGLLWADDGNDSPDLTVPDQPDEVNAAEDGVAWSNMQERIASVKPLTQQDIDRWKDRAVYDD